MQDRNENLLTSTGKINGFQSKLHLLQQHVKNDRLEMFSLPQKQRNANSAAFCEIIREHLKALEDKLTFYFPSAFTESFALDEESIR